MFYNRCKLRIPSRMLPFKVQCTIVFVNELKYNVIKVAIEVFMGYVHAWMNGQYSLV